MGIGFSGFGKRMAASLEKEINIIVTIQNIVMLNSCGCQ
jgi:hypothetical protein